MLNRTSSPDAQRSVGPDDETLRPPASGLQPRSRVLLGCDAAGTYEWLASELARRGAEVTVARTGFDVEQALENDGPFELVITSSHLPDKTGLGVLAHARSVRIETPFLVIVSGQRPMVRIMVSDGTGDVLSSRVVNGANLVALSTQLMQPLRAGSGRNA
jgi:DNA-binding response OmpR family regulator